MDFARIRTLTITALFSDDELFHMLVLKGGNAINLVYGLSVRTSLDLDFSLEQDFPNMGEAQSRMFTALRERFSSVGLVVFDERMEARPRTHADDRNELWGGYVLCFKLIDARRYAALGGDLEAIRRDAVEVGPDHLRTFTVDISKHEYCIGKTEAELDDYTIYVYTPSMIAIEKLRAICQQMPQYSRMRHPRPRARDFFDIHEVVTNAGVHMGDAENAELATRIFGAKDVPLSLIAEIPNHREFHRSDWPAVQSSVNYRVNPFDYYFDFVVEQTKPLEPLWII